MRDRTEQLERALGMMHSSREIDFFTLGALVLARTPLVERERERHGLGETTKEYGQALYDLLNNAIESLGISQENIDIEIDRQQAYEILHGEYIEGELTKTLARQLGISLREFQNRRKAAVEVLEGQLLRWEEIALAEGPFAAKAEQAPAPGLCARVAEIPWPAGKVAVAACEHRWAAIAIMASLVLAMMVAVLQISRLPLARTIIPSPESTADLTPQRAGPMPAPSPMPMSQTGGAVTPCQQVRTIQPEDQQFIAPYGVVVFVPQTSRGPAQGRWIRSLVATADYLWTAYNAKVVNPIAGVGRFDRHAWEDCNGLADTTGRNVNALFVDSSGRVWVGTEDQGVRMQDPSGWHTFTTLNGLPSNMTYGFGEDEQHRVWVATFSGVAVFEGQGFSLRYGDAGPSAVWPDARAHAIAFDGTGGIWVGLIHDGVQHWDASRGAWDHIKVGNGLASQEVRRIAIRKASDEWPESVWVATDGGGVSKFEAGKWTTYRVADGLPGDAVRDLLVDRYGRVWAATNAGTAYREGDHWITYDRLDTYSLAAGPDCQGCVFNNDTIWTGTADGRITYSRLPYPDNGSVVQVVSVCVRPQADGASCPAVPLVTSGDVVTATVPGRFAPGQKLHLEVAVVPRSPYQLRQDRGDFLHEANANEDQRFGAWPQLAVAGVIGPGQPFTFATSPDDTLTAPEPQGQPDEVFVTHWRTWMDGRYVGPQIAVQFEVHRP